MSTALPVADGATMRRRALALLRKHRRAAVFAALLHLSAAAAALVPPRLLGHLVGGVGQGLTQADVNRTTLLLAATLLTAAGLTRWARLRSFVLGEAVLAEVREDFVEGVLSLPLGTVERAGSGDLLTRTTADVDSLGKTVRFAVPEVAVAVLRIVATAVAMLLVAPLPAAAGILVALPFVTMGTRWYLARAPQGYLTERRMSSEANSRMAESMSAGRTVEALGLQQHRIDLAEDDLRRVYDAERYTLRLRCVYFPTCEVTYVLPVVTCLLLGGLLALHGHLTLAALTALTLYAQQLVEPVDQLLSWLDEVQVGGASFARLLGVRDVVDDRTVSDLEPVGEQIEAEAARFSYVEGREVLAGVNLALVPGERLAIVGPSGAGKSTLGRLLAGIHPPSSGAVTVGSAPLVGLPLTRLRREVALVTQEHHVFAGTVADNLRLAVPGASDEALVAALAAVDWAGPGLAEQVGSGGLALPPAQAQQLALARLVLADPHTLVLDEATSLLDPRAARHLERSLSTVVAGRTVVAIAHRLQTASDADRVAVVEDGRVVELGTHDELVAAGGSYAALWRSWHG